MVCDNVGLYCFEYGSLFICGSGFGKLASKWNRDGMNQMDDPKIRACSSFDRCRQQHNRMNSNEVVNGGDHVAINGETYVRFPEPMTSRGRTGIGVHRINLKSCDDETRSASTSLFSPSKRTPSIKIIAPSTPTPNQRIPHLSPRQDDPFSSATTRSLSPTPRSSSPCPAYTKKD